jgi:hypothetical protein
LTLATLGKPTVTHVSVQKGAGHNLLTVAQFLALPVNERITLVFAKKVVFLDDHGNVVPLADGLAYVSSLVGKRK